MARDLFALQGARELLLQCGFQAWLELAADGTILVLPATAPLSKLKEGLKQLMEAAEASIKAAREAEGGGGKTPSLSGGACVSDGMPLITVIQ